MVEAHRQSFSESQEASLYPCPIPLFMKHRMNHRSVTFCALSFVIPVLICSRLSSSSHSVCLFSQFYPSHFSIQAYGGMPTATSTPTGRAEGADAMSAPGGPGRVEGDVPPQAGCAIRAQHSEGGAPPIREEEEQRRARAPPLCCHLGD